MQYEYHASKITRYLLGKGRRTYPDSKVHGANMRPIWGRQDPGGPHVGPMNLDIWVDMVIDAASFSKQTSSY